MEEYARRMASSRCDGDHITLQALCDALKVRLGEGGGTEERGRRVEGSIEMRLSIGEETSSAGGHLAPPCCVVQQSAINTRDCHYRRGTLLCGVLLE